MLFHLFAQNYDSVYTILNDAHKMKKEGKEVGKNLNEFFSRREFIEDLSPDVIPMDEKEKIAFEAFETIFNKQ